MLCLTGQYHFLQIYFFHRNLKFILKKAFCTDNELFLLYGWQTKVVYPYFQPGLIEGSSPVRISNTPQAGFEPAENLNSGLVEWSCAVVINNTLQHHHYNHYIEALYGERLGYEFATCLSCLFVSLILLCRFVLILPGTHLSQEKKKGDKVCIFSWNTDVPKFHILNEHDGIHQAKFIKSMSSEKF